MPNHGFAPDHKSLVTCNTSAGLDVEAMQCLHDIVYYIIVSSELNSISDESWLRVMITYGGSIDEVKQIMIKTGWVVVMRKLDIRGVLKSDCLLRNSLVINFMSLPRVVLCVTRRSGETSLTNTANCCIGSVRLVLGWYCCTETPNHYDPKHYLIILLLVISCQLKVIVM